MTYTVVSAPGTPFEDLINQIGVVSLSNNKTEVTLTGTMTEKDDLNMDTKKKILGDTYYGIINGLKNLHERKKGSGG